MEEPNESANSRLALLGIVVGSTDSAEAVQRILHDFRDSIVARMGVPHRGRGVSILSVIVDAPAATVSALAGKLGMLPAVTAKTLFTREQ